MHPYRVSRYVWIDGQINLKDISRPKLSQYPIRRYVRQPLRPPYMALLHGIFPRHVTTVYVYAYVYNIGILVDVTVSVRTIAM